MNIEGVTRLVTRDSINNNIIKNIFLLVVYIIFGMDDAAI